MRKIRSLHINTERTWRGGEVQTFYLVDSLQKMGEDTFVICKKGGKLADALRGTNISFEEVNMRGELDIMSARAIAKIVNKFGADVVHAHTSHAHSLAAIASLFFKNDVKIVVSRRVSFSIKKGKSILNKLKYKFYKVNMFVSVCDAISDMLAEEGIDREKLRTVYSSTDHERFDPENVDSNVRDELSIKDDAIVITKIAHFSNWKGYDTFFQAAKNIIKQNDNVRFIIAGSKTTSDEVVSKIKALGIEKRFHCLGIRNDMPELLKASDICVNAAYAGEGLSGAIRESLFMAVPIVASDVAGNKEVCIDNKTGLLFKPKDVDGLTDKLIKLISDKELRIRLGRTGREFVLNGFTVDVMAKRTLDIYRELVE
ncbi:glycosyltransferase family 4 protein [Thermodesulfobacteriota bacterium]